MGEYIAEKEKQKLPYIDCPLPRPCHLLLCPEARGARRSPGSL
jgi:hypothetical protein